VDGIWLEECRVSDARWDDDHEHDDRFAGRDDGPDDGESDHG
jgi:hypothetical protein